LDIRVAGGELTKTHYIIIAQRNSHYPMTSVESGKPGKGIAPGWRIKPWQQEEN
jgi:hypothetical protein